MIRESLHELLPLVSEDEWNKFSSSFDNVECAAAKAETASVQTKLSIGT